MFQNTLPHFNAISEIIADANCIDADKKSIIEYASRLAEKAISSMNYNIVLSGSQSIEIDGLTYYVASPVVNKLMHLEALNAELSNQLEYSQVETDTSETITPDATENENV